MLKAFLITSLLGWSTAFAAAKTVPDGSEFPECHGVTDVCMAAGIESKNVKTGMLIKGYQPGDHGVDGRGLWIDCVGALMKGQSVMGLAEPVTQAAAQACAHAYGAKYGKH